MSNESTFGAWLKQRRKELGVTQEELSNQLGLSLALLRKLESAERRPSGQITYLLAQYFRVPADEQAAFMAFARTGKMFATDVGPLSPNKITSTAPWRGAYLHQTNLPTMLTPIIGREREKLVGLNMLLHSKTRLLTLTGTAGVGKTRLGLEIATSLVDNFDDGVFFVNLAPVIDPERVVATIARTLGLQQGGAQNFEQAILNYLRERRVLLFLDNFEHVLDAATLVVQMLEASPWVKVLVSSRELLHVRGERRLSVPPLGLPDSKQLEGLVMPGACPSMDLFIERVQAVIPDFDLTLENASDVAAICLKLEGVPLAIELAAARARHFSPKEIHAGLNSQLNLLTDGSRDLPVRQRTLRNAIEWSYKLLNANEQRLLRFAGVFVGGFTSEALSWLDENQASIAVSTSDTLMALVDKNLVHNVSKSTKSTEVRFGLLEAVREYAVEQLTKQGEMADARRRQAGYHLELAERSEQHFTGTQHSKWGTDQVGWDDRLEADLDNIRMGLDWYCLQVETIVENLPQNEPGANSLYLENLQKGLRLATAMRRVWFIRGHFTEGMQWLTGLVSRVPKPLPVYRPELKAIYAKAIAIMGRLAYLSGNIEVVRPLVEESLSIATELEDPELTAFILFISGSIALSQGEYQAARSLQTRCLKLYKELGNKWGMASVLQDLGFSALNQGNSEVAYPMLKESLQLFREVSENVGVGSVLSILGQIAYHQANYGEARLLWQESIHLTRQTGYKSVLGYPEVMLGWVALREGYPTQAEILFKEGIHLGQISEAMLSIYWGLVGLGALARTQHQTEPAVLLFAAAEAFGTAKKIQLTVLKRAELQQEIAFACTQLPEEKWNDTWIRGQATLAEVTEEPGESRFRLAKALTNLLNVAEGLTNQVPALEDAKA